MAVYISGEIFSQPVGAAVGAAGISYFAFVIFRLHTARATVAAFTYMSLAAVLDLRDYHEHLLSRPALVIGIGAPLVCYLNGIVASIAMERVLRQSFRQSRIIEIQGQTIESERMRSEALLANMLPQPIVARLKRSPDPIADKHNQVTVLFADIVGFTPLSTRLSPAEVVECLNRIFTRFDSLAIGHEVEKIKTIGDAWMAVAGMPLFRPDHADAIADLAMDMTSAVDELRTCTGHPIQFRIGIESGPVVAGVIGTTKYAYDLWGDTVNTAARLESHGEPNRIQVGPCCFEILQHRYEFATRGIVDLKGKGPTMTYFLTGRASPDGPARTADGQGHGHSTLIDRRTENL